MDNPGRGSPHVQPKIINVRVSLIHMRRVRHITKRARVVSSIQPNHDACATLLTGFDAHDSTDFNRTDNVRGAGSHCPLSINVVDASIHH